MAGLSGIVKKISDLVTGTPADDDCFVFGKSNLKKITLAKLKDVLGIASINSALKVKTYSRISEANGFETTAFVQGNIVTFKVRGSAAVNLGTSNNYAGVGTFSQLSSLITIGGARIKRIPITSEISGQIRFNTDSLQLQIGYTYNQDGESVDIPSGTTLYLEETFIL